MEDIANSVVSFDRDIGHDAHFASARASTVT